MNAAPAEVWRGSANAWECDHLGHLNTRFYLARVELALAGFLAAAGAARGPLPITAQHIRFHREVRSGAALHATAQRVAGHGASEEILVALYHSADAALAATFRLTVEEEAFSGLAAAAAPLAPLPSAAAERGLAMAEVQVPAGAPIVPAGFQRTGLSAISRDHCDEHGRWRLSAAMGMLADCVAHFHHGDWQQVLARSLPEPPGRIGSALVEFGFRHRRWPGPGDRVEVHSALTDCTDRVVRAVHWLLDPACGEAWAAVRTVGVALDLDARRLLALTPEAQAAIRARAAPLA